MATDTFSCPECRAKLRRSPHLPAGAQVQCPRCRFQFPVPPPGEEPAETEPPRFGGAYGETPGWQHVPPGEAEARHNDLVGTGPRDDRRPGGYDMDRDPYDRDPYDRDYRRPPDDDEDYPGPRQRGSLEQLNTDYTVDVGRWLAFAREHYSAVVGPAAGYLFLVQLINAVLGFVPAGNLAAILLNPPLQAGMTLVSLAQLKGRSWVFKDFFGGFKFFGPTVGLSILQGLAIAGILVVGGIIAVIVGMVIAQSAPGGGPPVAAFLVGGAIGMVALLVAAIIGVRLSFFALPLVLDRNFGVSEAMSGSWRLSRGHVGGLFGAMVLVALINGVPFVLGGAGAGLAAWALTNEPMFIFLAAPLGGSLLLVFTVPFTTLFTTAAYLDVAGSQAPVSRHESGAVRGGREEDY